MFDDTYKTILHPSEGVYKDKGSKFIALVFPVKKEEEIKTHLAETRKKFFDARHHCYAWALGPARDAYRTNDDGEPSGTAGKPIYGQILSHELTDILIIVVRYFGGVKLGVRGLIDAYKSAAADALSNNEIIIKLIMETYEVEFEYPLMNVVMKLLKDQEAELLHHDHQLNCKIRFALRRNNSQRLLKSFQQVSGVNVKYLHT
jgi:uncharacterized YigZ family protein